MRNIYPISDINTVDDIDIGTEVIKKTGINNGRLYLIELIVFRLTLFNQLTDPGSDDLE